MLSEELPPRQSQTKEVINLNKSAKIRTWLAKSLDSFIAQPTVQDFKTTLVESFGTYQPKQAEAKALTSWQLHEIAQAYHYADENESLVTALQLAEERDLSNVVAYDPFKTDVIATPNGFYRFNGENQVEFVEEQSCNCN